MREQDIRQAVNAFSRQGSGHPFTDYGNKIHIKVNDDCTIKECIVRTQYEERDSEEKRRPYKGWDIAPQRYVNIHDVNPWKFNLKTPDDFTDKESYLEVEGSARVTQCQSCSGKGRSTCTTCFGNARELCPTCHGRYDHLTCRDCNGSGYVICPECHGQVNMVCGKCGGRGSISYKTREQQYQWDYQLQKQVLKEVEVTKEKRCEACSGRGRWRCGTCSGTTEKRGYIRCRTCRNMGYVTCRDCTQGYILCKTCSGQGSLVCGTCSGEGQNEYRFIVNRHLKKKTFRSILCDGRVREFAEKHSPSRVSVDFTLRQGTLGEDLYPSDVRCSSALSKLVDKASAASDGKILFQEAVARHYEATYIEYEYDGEMYTGIICDNIFHPDRNPIDEWSAEALENAGKKIRRGSSAATLKMLDQVEQAGGDRREIADLRAKAYKKLRRIHSAGVSTAFWLIAIVITPILFNFYNKLNPVAPWAIVTNNTNWWAYNFVPLCQCLIFLALILALRGKFINISEDAGKKQHASIWIYFVRGFGGYLLASLGLMAAFIALNWCGLSIITTFITGIIIKIIIIAIAIVYLIFHLIFSILGKIF